MIGMPVRSAAGLVLGAVLAAAPGHTCAQGRDAPGVPCGPCASISLSVEQALALDTAGGALAGLRIVVRAGHASTSALRSAVDRVHSFGARAGAAAAVDDQAAPALATDVDPVILDLSGAPATAQTAFRVKAIATTWRGRGATRIAVELDPDQLASAAFQGLAPYVDLVVSGGRAMSSDGPLGRMERWTNRQLARREVSDAASDLLSVFEQPSRDGVAGVLVGVPEGAEAMVPVLARLARALPAGLVPLPEVGVTCDATCDATAYLDTATLEAAVVVRPAAGRIGRVTVTPWAGEVAAVVPAAGDARGAWGLVRTSPPRRLVRVFASNHPWGTRTSRRRWPSRA